MSDPIAAALARNQTLDDPNILREDKPPMLEFERETREDRMTTEQTGRYGFRDVIVVYVRAFGDVKTRVPFIVWEKIHEPVLEMVAVRKPVPVQNNLPCTGAVDNRRRRHRTPHARPPPRYRAPPH